VVQIGGSPAGNGNNITIDNYMQQSYLAAGTHTFYRFGVNGYGPGNFREFKVEEGNTKYKAIDGVLFSKDGTRLLAYPSSKSGTTYQIPEGVTIIDEVAFSHTYYNKSSDRLQKIILPDSYTVRMPENNYPNQINPQNSLTNALYKNSGVKEIAIKPTNTKYMVEDGVLYSKDGSTCLYIPAYKNNVNIREGCTSINGAYLTPTTALRTASEKTFVINIPASVTYIDDFGNTTYPEENTMKYLKDLKSMSNYYNTTFNIDPNNTVYTVNASGYIVKK
jgi:hypothetical protein